MIAAPSVADPVTVFAASSLKTALDTVIAQRGLDVVAVYGGSAAIARQVTQGAQADIVILAHPEWMDWLARQEALQPGSQCNLLGNQLVLAGAANAADLELTGASDLLSALNGQRLAVGQLASVPAGQYTAAYWAQEGWLDALRPHLAETSNVRLALALIARGEVPLGFVYASDVAAEPRVRTVFSPNNDAYPAIRYPMARTLGGSGKSAAIAQALTDAREVFETQGFSSIPLAEPDRCQ